MFGEFHLHPSQDEAPNFVYVAQDPVDFNSKKRKRPNPRAKRACLNCRKSHVSCSDQRPCKRCVDRGISCVDDSNTNNEEHSIPTKPTQDLPPQTIAYSQNMQNNVGVANPNFEINNYQQINFLSPFGEESQQDDLDKFLDGILAETAWDQPTTDLNFSTPPNGQTSLDLNSIQVAQQQAQAATTQGYLPQNFVNQNQLPQQQQQQQLFVHNTSQVTLNNSFQETSNISPKPSSPPNSNIKVLTPSTVNAQSPSTLSSGSTPIILNTSQPQPYHQYQASPYQPHALDNFFMEIIGEMSFPFSIWERKTMNLLYCNQAHMNMFLNTKAAPPPLLPGEKCSPLNLAGPTAPLARYPKMFDFVSNTDLIYAPNGQRRRTPNLMDICVPMLRTKMRKLFLSLLRNKTPLIQDKNHQTLSAFPEPVVKSFSGKSVYVSAKGAYVMTRYRLHAKDSVVWVEQQPLAIKIEYPQHQAHQSSVQSNADHTDTTTSPANKKQKIDSDSVQVISQTDTPIEIIEPNEYDIITDTCSGAEFHSVENNSVVLIDDEYEVNGIYHPKTQDMSCVQWGMITLEDIIDDIHKLTLQ